MDHFMEQLSARVDATASDLKTSLHSHVDSTVDSRLDTFKRELCSMVRSGVVECIRAQGSNQHWRVETTYTPVSAHCLSGQVPLIANHSTSFIEGIPSALLTEGIENSGSGMPTTSQCISDVTFPSGQSVSIPLYNVPNQHQLQHLSEQSTHHDQFELPPSAVSIHSSLLPNVYLHNTEQNTSSQSAQTSNNEQINDEPFQTETRASLLSIDVSSVSPSNVSTPARTVQPSNGIHIKQEHLDDQSDNGQLQQMDNDDPDTDAHNVTFDIKTESMDCGFVVVKQEIKEEDDHEDDCDGCDRCIVKRELLSDDDDNSMQLDDSGNADQVIQSNLNQSNDASSGDQPNTANNSAFQYAAPNEQMEVTNNLVNEDSVNQQMTGGNEDQLSLSTQVFQLSCEQVNEVINSENGLVDEDEQNLDGDEDMSNSTNDNDHRSVVELNEPSTSALRQSNQIASKPSTSSTHHNATKRKQPPLNRTVKRSKKTLEEEDGEDEVDIANEDRDEGKIKVLHLNCTESKCSAKLDSLDDLYDHLRTVHRLLPFQCFATNCNERFDSRTQIRMHIKQHHSRNTQFLCSVCHQEYDTQKLTHRHWYQAHLNGQFQCNFVNDCVHVTDTRNKMKTHQAKHRPQDSQPKYCTFNGCTASFFCKSLLKRHESSHLDSKPFHCNWLQCNHRTNRRSHLITHIRVKHFGLPSSVKEQKAKNIVDERNPNEFVRVVEEVEE